MQFFIFMICLFCGVLSGVVYDVLYVARCALCGIDKHSYTVKDKIFIAAADILYCAVFAAGFVFTSVMFDFYAIRAYMLLGCVLGALIYLKSFHVIVAFCVKKVYNKINLCKENAVERTKAQPHGGGNNRKRNTVNRHTRRRRHLSVGGNVAGKKQTKPSGSRAGAVRTAD